VDISEHIAQIGQQGFTILPGVYSAGQVERALQLAAGWYERAAQAPLGSVPFLNRNQPMVYNLQNKDSYFLELLFGSDTVNDVLSHFLNDPWFTAIPSEKPNYILRSYLARSSNETLPMHIDSFVPYGGDHVFVMQCSIILEPQTVENGCTLVVPGSHRVGEWATQDSFSDAVPVESNPGDVVLWDSRLWHGTGPNRTGGTRWALIATFCRWWLKQAFNITNSLPDEIYQRLTSEQRAILGFCSVPYDDEGAGVDMKRGYEALPAQVRGGVRPAHQVSGGG
jgi:hypothetical protein